MKAHVTSTALMTGKACLIAVGVLAVVVLGLSIGCGLLLTGLDAFGRW
jgi:hypothetical protein